MEIINMNDGDAVERRICELQDILEMKRGRLREMGHQSFYLNKTFMALESWGEENKLLEMVRAQISLMNRGMNFIDDDMRRCSDELYAIFNNMDANTNVIWFP